MKNSDLTAGLVLSTNIAHISMNCKVSTVTIVFSYFYDKIFFMAFSLDGEYHVSPPTLNPTTRPDGHERGRYMTEQGWTRSSDIGHRVVEEVMKIIPMAQMTADSPHVSPFIDSPEVPPQGWGFAAYIRTMSRAISDETRGEMGPSEKMLAMQGSPNPEYYHFTFDGGLADLEFTWSFAGFAANALAVQFVNDGHITREQLETVTFSDWADMIGSEWFASLMHDCALTTNGVYLSIGEYSYDYLDPDTASRTLLNNAMTKYIPNLGEVPPEYPLTPDSNIPSMFKTSIERVESVGEEQASEYLVGRLSPYFREILRRAMHHDSLSSVGCPVARKHSTLTQEQVAEDQHLASLVDAGYMVSTGESQRGIRFNQERTPIDTALSVLAERLATYDRLYGTPRIDHGLQHDKQPPSFVFKHESTV